MTLKILLTGGTSFTGLWFARELAARGHDVIAPVTADIDSYQGVRAERVAHLLEVARVISSAPVGSENLARTVAELDRIDVVCLHHAVVGDYQSAEFDVSQAVASATAGALPLLAAAHRKGTRGVVLTHSIFEGGRGISDDPRPIGMYAVAKTAVGGVWSERARQLGLPVSEFTIANPFGPLEEPRLVSYLVRSWQSGVTPTLKAPEWVRDNLPAPLLAASYADVVEAAAVGLVQRVTPSHTVVSNLEFARLIGSEFASRWGFCCPVDRTAEHLTAEPRVRVGVNRLAWSQVPSSVTTFWDQYADFYASSRDSLSPKDGRIEV